MTLHSRPNMHLFTHFFSFIKTLIIIYITHCNTIRTNSSQFLMSIVRQGLLWSMLTFNNNIVILIGIICITWVLHWLMCIFIKITDLLHDNFLLLHALLIVRHIFMFLFFLFNFASLNLSWAFMRVGLCFLTHSVYLDFV